MTPNMTRIWVGDIRQVHLTASGQFLRHCQPRKPRNDTTQVNFVPTLFQLAGLWSLCSCFKSEGCGLLQTCLGMMSHLRVAPSNRFAGPKLRIVELTLYAYTRRYICLYHILYDLFVHITYALNVELHNEIYKQNNRLVGVLKLASSRFQACLVPSGKTHCVEYVSRDEASHNLVKTVIAVRLLSDCYLPHLWSPSPWGSLLSCRSGKLARTNDTGSRQPISAVYSGAEYSTPRAERFRADFGDSTAWSGHAARLPAVCQENCDCWR